MASSAGTGSCTTPGTHASQANSLYGVCVTAHHAGQMKQLNDWHGAAAHRCCRVWKGCHGAGVVFTKGAGRGRKGPEGSA